MKLPASSTTVNRPAHEAADEMLVAFAVQADFIRGQGDSESADFGTK